MVLSFFSWAFLPSVFLWSNICFDSLAHLCALTYLHKYAFFPGVGYYFGWLKNETLKVIFSQFFEDNAPFFCINFVSKFFSDASLLIFEDFFLSLK